MSFKSLFVGGLPDETYGQGVRRRLKNIVIVWGFVLFSLILCYSTFALFASVWVTLGAAVICGIASIWADVGLAPIKGGSLNNSEKLMWLILFIPALALLGAVSGYSALHARDGFDVFKAGISAGVFGWLLGGTALLLLRTDSRARV